MPKEVLEGRLAVYLVRNSEKLLIQVKRLGGYVILGGEARQGWEVSRSGWSRLSHVCAMHVCPGMYTHGCARMPGLWR